MSLHEQITQEIQRLIDVADADIITPASLALAVQHKYGDDLEPHIAYLSLEHLKQMSRRALAARYDVESDDSEAVQGELFSGHLQERYPLPRSGGQEPSYKRLDALTPTEVVWNIAKLRRVSQALQAHSDALEAWHQSRIAAE